MRIILAHEPPFHLGELWVEPAFRQVTGTEISRTLEPRVMQVLVALAQADGGIVGRDALIERCWDGRVVGENAINRVISLLRQLAAETRGFEIETITKVGYRLNVAGVAKTRGPLPATSEKRTFPRRSMLGLLGAAAVAGSGYVLLPRRPSARRREADHYYRAGIESDRRGDGSIRQAIANYEKAVETDPRHAAAWGALARALLALTDGMDERRIDPIMRRSKSAAAEALRLDPRNSDALTAQVLAEPWFGNWAAVEERARAALALRPDLNLVRLKLALTLANTGRFRESLGSMQQVAAREPLVPLHQTRLAWLLWQTGRADEARRVFDHAFATWPNHMWTWCMRAMFLTLTGAVSDALAMTERDQAFGAKIGPLPIAVAKHCAYALAPRADGRERANAIAAIKSARSDGSIASFVSIPYLSALGDVDTAFEHAHGYYLGRRDSLTGERQPLARYADRWTDLLFARSTQAMRTDPRFARLTDSIGLDDYWRATGSRPDYRIA